MQCCKSGSRFFPARTIWLAVAALASTGPALGQTALFVWDTSDELWEVETGPPLSSTLVGPANSNVTIAEIEAGIGVIYGAHTRNARNLRLIDPASGMVFETLTLAYPPEGNTLTALEFIDGVLYGGLTSQGGGSSHLATIDLESGVVTVVGPTGVASPLGGLAFDLSTSTLYAVSAGGSQAELFTVDIGTGGATSVGIVVIGEGQNLDATALEFGSDGVLYLLPNISDPLVGHLLSIDPATAMATDLGDTGVPSPNSLTLDTVILADGFESGDFSAWNGSVP